MVANSTWILASTFTLFNNTTTNVICEDPANMFKAAVNMVNLIPDSAKDMVTLKVNSRLKNSERRGNDKGWLAIAKLKPLSLFIFQF